MTFLFDVSWEVCNKATELYSDIESKVQQSTKSGDQVVAIGPDFEQGAPVFHDEVWDPKIFEAISTLPFPARMGRWQIAGNPRCILIKTDKLQGRRDVILEKYGQALRSGLAPAQSRAVDTLLFAFGAGQLIEQVYSRVFRPQGITATVRGYDWPMLATTLFLKEKTPELGAIFSAPTTAPTASAAPTLNLDVVQKFPQALQKLEEMIYGNLWWSWQPEAVDLVASLDRNLWLESGHDVVVFLRNLKPKALATAGQSKDFLARLDRVYAAYRDYLGAKKTPEVAYFCMEYGLGAALRFYSGGLGILAGDHLKTASDLNIPLCAIGFAFREGYFKQVITADGSQTAAYEFTDFSKTAGLAPVTDSAGNRVKIKVSLPQTNVTVQAWRVMVGRVDLYMLDTDVPENRAEDRKISDRLYGGDNEHRLVQEMVLSVGGLKLLDAIGIKPKAFHMNEGHTSFLNLERLLGLVKKEGLALDDAIEYLRHSTIFTTHTPVPAGHDRFSEALIRPYLKTYADQLGIEVRKVHLLGVEPGKSETSQFSTTALCVRTCDRINGVSAIHGDVSRRMFQPYFPGFTEEEIPVTSITNGVHATTWLAPEWNPLFNKTLGIDWMSKLSDGEYWTKARHLDSRAVWETHQELKGQLLRWLKQYLKRTWGGRTTELAQALAVLDCKPFVATYARRFATYKRPALLLKDLERLRKVFDSARVPVVFLFAGKAHPMDKPGQEVIRKVVEASRTPEFAGKIIFVENYDMDKAAKLVRGSDIWINNPTRPLEASGTSGMKAAMNGCLNLSVPDGWWAEASNGRNGWSIGDASLDLPTDFQEAYDSTQIYLKLMTEVLPLYERVNNHGVPEQWVDMMKDSMATIVPMFSTDRMLSDYDRMFYRPAIEDAVSLKKDSYARLKQIGVARKKLFDQWRSVEIMGVQTEPAGRIEVVGAEPLQLKVQVKHPELKANDLVVQALISCDEEELEFRSVPMTAVSPADGNSVWNATLEWEKPGSTRIGVRVTPKAPIAATPEPDYDLNLVRWL